jgi:protein involved in polysaccharide export with SLBB domain
MMNCRRGSSRGSGYPLTFSILHLSFCIATLAACGTTPSPTQDPSPAPSGIRPGDVVKIVVWREPDYTGEFPVDARGRVVLPQLGTMMVAGRPTEWLSDSLTTAYRKFLANPSITIAVLMRVTVSGEVGKPGSVLADRTMTVGDLISQAGGLTPQANRNKIELLRNGRVVGSGLGPGTLLQRSPVQSGDQVFVPQRGWFSRNGQYFLVGAISVASAVTAAILVRR